MSPALKAAGYCVYALDYGAAVVGDLVGLSPSNHGTTNPLAGPAAVSYTNIVTRYDEVVIPYTSGYLAPDPRVTDVTLQDKCPGDTSEHLRTPYDPPAIQITLDALGRAGPADPGFQPACG